MASGQRSENGPTDNDPALGAATISDPATDHDVVAIGTTRYDPGHGWYEVHPVTAHFAPLP